MFITVVLFRCRSRVSHPLSLNTNLLPSHPIYHNFPHPTMSRPTTPSVSVPTSTSYPLPLNTSAPVRSTTAPAESKHHIPHHTHRHHHHHSRDKSVPQSAIQLSTKPFSQILSPIISNAGSKSDGINDASHSQHSRSSSAVAQEARARKEEEDKRVRKGWRIVESKRERRRGFDEYVTSCLDL